MIIVAQPKKLLELGNIRRVRPRSNSIYLVPLHLYSRSIQNIPKKLHLLEQQCTLVGAKVQLVCSQTRKHSIQCSFVFHNSLTKDEQIIQVDHYASVQQIKEHCVHHTLEGTWCILKSKWHNIELEGTISTGKSSLIPILRSN